MSKSNSKQDEIKIKVSAKGVVETKKELDGAKISSEELAESFRALEKKVESLTQELEDMSKASEKASTSGDFSSFSTAVRGAAVATQGVVSGLALIGVEGDKVAETLLQVQAAMAFADSISQITEMGSELMDLKTQVSGVYSTLTAATKTQTTVQGTLNAVMAANPVGAIVVAVAALVAGLALLGYGVVKLVGYFKDHNNASDKARTKTESLTKEIEKQNREIAHGREAKQKSLSHEYAMAVASGKSAEELRKLRLEMIETRAQIELNNATKAKASLEDAERAVAEAKMNGASKAAIKELNEVREGALKSFLAINDAYVDTLDAKLVEMKAQQVEERQELTNHNIKIADERKAAAERALEERKREREEELEGINKHAKELQKAKYKIENDRAKADQDKKDKDAEREKTHLELKLKDLQDAIAREKAVEEARVQVKEDHEKRKGEIAWQGLDLVKQIFAENVAVQKAALIIENAATVAKIVQSTVTAVSKAGSAFPLTGGMPFSGFAIAQGAIGVASTIAATVKGLKAMGGGSPGGEGTSMPTGPTAPQMGASMGPQVDFQAPGASQVGNSVSQVRGELPPVKAYVVSKDMTNQQEADRYMRESNTI